MSVARSPIRSGRHDRARDLGSGTGMKYGDGTGALWQDGSGGMARLGSNFVAAGELLLFIRGMRTHD